MIDCIILNQYRLADDTGTGRPYILYVTVGPTTLLLESMHYYQ